jgi:membrane dipeptidase
MIVDGHNDLVLKLWLGVEPVHLDLATARAAGFAGGFFALYVPNAEPFEEPAEVPYAVPLASAIPLEPARQIALSLADTFDRLELRVARRASDFRPGEVTAILHLEGAEPLAPDLSDLDEWVDRGVRSIGLVWSRPNAFGEGVPFRFPATPDTGPGLTDAGRALVRACNERGVLVDVSHLNAAGFWEVAEVSDAPLVATHSNAWTLCNSTRNLQDDQLDAIASSGGVVGVNFATGFLRADGRNDPETPLDEIVRHVDYLVERLGPDHVAFGSDFEGAVMPDALGGAAGLPRLVELVAERGHDAAKIASGNWLRVLDATLKPFARYFAAAGDEPRPTLLDAVARFDAPGFAVDLGAGTGRDTAELLRRGWRVLAIDSEADAVDRLRELAGDSVLHARFENARWPECDLVNASYALPFCAPEAFPALWARIVASLRPGGRFSGQLFGDRDEWAGDRITTQTRTEVDELLAPFAVEHFEEFEGQGQTAIGATKHWHLFHVVARKV